MEMSGRKKKNQRGAAIVLEAVTRREQSLALFHLLGKVLYNKRKTYDFFSVEASCNQIYGNYLF